MVYINGLSQKLANWILRSSLKQRGESQGGEDAGDGDDAAHRGQRRGWIPRGVFQQTFSMGGCHEKWCCHGDFIIKNDDFHGISMDLWHQKW